METFVVAKNINGQLVVLCPWCKKRHFHGALGGFGVRAAHCASGPGVGREYVLIDAPKPPPK